MTTIIGDRSGGRGHVRPAEGVIHRRLRDALARVLLVLAAAGAVFGVATGVEATASASAETMAVEFWRTAGLGFFAGVFLLLAWRPRRSAGVWELTILNKVALATFGLLVPADGSATFVLVDGALAVILVAAYVLSEGWHSWLGRRSVRGLRED